MGSSENNPFHAFLLLTEVPGRWAAWQIAPFPLALAAGAGLIWAGATGDPIEGGVVAAGLLLSGLADWGLLAALPRLGLSFGAVQPPFLGLMLFRWLIALLATPLASRWPLPALAGLGLAQALVWAFTAYGMLVEPFRLQVTRLEIPSAKLNNPGAALHLVQLSDLHVERLTRRERALPALVADLAPDLVFLTGDFLSTSYNDDPHALADLRELLGQIHATAGLYAVWGTVEVDLPGVLRPLLDELGIVVLEDRATEVMAGGHCLWLMGPACTRDLAADGARLRAMLACAPPCALTLLLYHTPDLMPQAAALGVDLYLAGHTHGGQWRLPGLGAILTSSHYWKRYEAGHYHEGSTDLYVSRGLGMEGFGTPRARFFCPPEVVSLTVSGLKGTTHHPGSEPGQQAGPLATLRRSSNEEPISPVEGQA
jgi:predicted MPP superfamily phosphohydrolase